jgi:thiamine transport system permease protein
MIFRLLTRPGATSFGMAMALSVVLALITAAVVIAMDRARIGELGAF